jgi:hypothetical protein
MRTLAEKKLLIILNISILNISFLFFFLILTYTMHFNSDKNKNIWYQNRHYSTDRVADSNIRTHGWLIIWSLAHSKTTTSSKE